jgi:alpha-tubulin suppressor-like RCC1 family protein
MTLNTSGPISLNGTIVGQSIDLELGGTGSGTRSFNDAEVRELAGIMSGPVSMFDFYGKSLLLEPPGALWTWGSNFYGGLGDNTTTNKSSPVQTISAGTNWKQVSCGYHTAAIKTDGTLWVWGSNSDGQLGDNTNTYQSSPVQTIAGGTNWKQVAGGWFHTAAIKTDGTLWTWGSNFYGGLGDNTTTNKSSPVQTIAGGTNWKQVSCGTWHTAAIR